MRLLNKVIFHCVVPICLGACIYLFLRPGFAFSIREIPRVQHPDTILEKLFVFSLPDFFWSYSFASALYLFAFQYHINYKKAVLGNVIFILGSEMVQVLFPERFTFDIYDLIAAGCAIILSTFMLKSDI